MGVALHIIQTFPSRKRWASLVVYRRRGKIRHIGLSAVNVDQIKRARSTVEIETVQNEYNLGTRKHKDVVEYCEEYGIAFIPFYLRRSS